MSEFNSVIQAIESDEFAQGFIAVEALRNLEGYCGYGQTMRQLAQEVVSYWADIAASNGTIEDMRELEGVFDHYAEEANPSHEEKVALIGELWNYETSGESDTLDGFIASWCAAIGNAARYAYTEHVANEI